MLTKVKQDAIKSPDRAHKHSDYSRYVARPALPLQSPSKKHDHRQVRRRQAGRSRDPLRSPRRVKTRQYKGLDANRAETRKGD